VYSILTNRLQPSAIVDDATCAACDFNMEKNGCKRRLDWIWRGDYSPAGKLEYEAIKDQISREVLKDGRQFVDLSVNEQEKMVAARLKEYSKNAYRRTKITEEVTIKNTVCMRENDFYVETVRRFRDRRYDYKKMTKSWKKKVGSAIDAASRKEAEDKTLVYDSLQVAHKCILNSFYGYVMRKGARWRSMEMAGIVTKTGADLITQARVLVEQIGRPLELDTDGIWCILPKSFPDVYTFNTLDGSKLRMEYPCVMLNADVHDNFTNHQYQTLKDPKLGIYETRSDNSIFFEVDGPYRCMVLPASTEEGKLLKKRYAVFNFDGSLAELKGFELKRRGELELIKTFQSQVFQRFLDGSSLTECYDSVAEVANHWIDVIDTRGESLDDEELVDLISENRNMSRQLDDYGDQKGTSQTTARRLGEFLGAEIIKDKGLNCKFIIAEQPYGAPVTERAIPTAIWKAEPGIMKHFLRKWLKAPGMDGEAFDIRNVLDWDYYMERLSKTIQKIITIPAALQKVDNPVPRVTHPDWLHSKVQQLNDKYQQRSILSMFQPKLKATSNARNNRIDDVSEEASVPMDIEDIAGAANNGMGGRPVVHRTKRISKRPSPIAIDTVSDDESMPDTRVELTGGSFNSWLKQKKSFWKKARKQRKGRHINIREGADITSHKKENHTSSNTAVTTVESFARQGAISLIQNEWQIIEVRETTAVDTGKKQKTSSGEFVVWVMAGNDDLRKVQISVPRTVYVSAKQELVCNSSYIISFRKVDKHLPHGKTAKFLYEVSMPESVYRNTDWTGGLSAAKPHCDAGINLLDKIYETGTPLLTRALNDLGSVVKLTKAGTATKRFYNLADLKGLERPSEGLYLNERVSFRRNFLYVRMSAKTRSGLIALFSINGGSGEQATGPSNVDLTDPSKSGKGSFELGVSCQLWFVTKNQHISAAHCNDVFSELLSTIQESADVGSEYSCISPHSFCSVSKLVFLKKEQEAFQQVNTAIRTQHGIGSGPSFMIINSSKPTNHLRRVLPQLNNMPVISLPFPPGPDHNPTNSTLPALNWEQPMVQLSFEACLYMAVVSFPKRVSCSRYGNIPIGNLGEDEHFTLYNVCLSRMLQKNRAISWASNVPGHPDLGASFLPSSSKGGKPKPLIQMSDASIEDSEEIWNDDNELVSPVIRRPGTFRSICIDLDMQDLAIAALTDSSSMMSGHGGGLPTDPASPTSVMQMETAGGSSAALKLMEPLGDEMSTATSLPVLRALVAMWLRDAFTSNNLVADSMLHHVYRLVSSPSTLMHDAALHRAMHALMKKTFLQLLGELQRLGCTIVHATFHKITVSTNKTSLADAEEYVSFVTQTIRNNDENVALARVSLRPRMFHTQLVFLDEYNYGTMLLERHAAEDVNGTFVIEEDESHGTVVVPSVVTAFSLINYIGSEIAQEYFRIVLARFSKDVLKKENELKARNPDGAMLSMFDRELHGQLLAFKKKLISKQFAATLTRAVGDIGKEMEDEGDNAAMHRLLTLTDHPVNPVLEFVKSVIAILELDDDVDSEVHALKRSLLAQIGVAEYSRLAKWENPCPTLMLPDVFCAECQESRDINLCYIPPVEDVDQGKQIHWFCEDCGTEYDVVDIERRLVHLAHKKMLRYQLQDLRCTKTNRVATHSLARVSNCSAELKLDISQQQGTQEILTLHRLAGYHELDDLRATTDGMLSAFH
jgi:DNA polymerase epsilon subunit 1